MRPYLVVATAAAIAAAALAAAADESPLTTANVTREAFGQPLVRLPADQRESFLRGRSVFRRNWVVAPSSDPQADGLGPFYNRISCIACHAANGKGHAPDGPHERAGALLVRLSVPGTDAHGGPRPHPVYGDQLREEAIPGVPAPGRVAIAWREHAVWLADGTRVGLRAPVVRFRELAYGPLDGVRTSARVGPAVFGLGLLEAVPATALQDLARAAKPDGVRGKVNLVYDPETGHMLPGRFGLKANRATLRDQIAAAMQGDLGITSTLVPRQNCTPTQRACLSAPDGGVPELTDAQLDNLQRYLTYLAPPAPRGSDRPQVRQGAIVFRAAGCAVCHVPQLQVASHPLLGELAPATIAPYTDLLVHDMGKGLADGRPDYGATGRQWRTAPLWGAGLLKRMNERAGFLHDGRARDVQEAILWHSGEGEAARRRYMRLSPDERALLLAFIDSL